MGVSGVDPRTVGLNTWSVWRLQGLLGSLMSTRIDSGSGLSDWTRQSALSYPATLLFSIYLCI
jgi:hypothetical protein